METSYRFEDKMYFTCKDGLGWLAESLKDEYIKNNSWDSTAKPVSFEVYAEYALGHSPEGKMLGSTDDGYPCWVDIPPKTKNELIAEAEDKKRELMQNASEVISPLQDAIDLEMATEEEKQKLTKWKKYRVLLNCVDTSTAPDIDWPKKPE